MEDGRWSVHVGALLPLSSSELFVVRVGCCEDVFTEALGCDENFEVTMEVVMLNTRARLEGMESRTDRDWGVSTV